MWARLRRRGMRIHLLTIPLLITTLAMSGCGEQPDTPPDSTSAVAAKSGPQTLMLTSVTGAGSSLVAKPEVDLTISGQDVTFNAGCNSHFGTLRVEGDRWFVDNIGSTEMACEKALMDQDSFLAQFFEGGPKVTESGDSVTFTSGPVRLVFGPKTAKPATVPLVGTKWRLVSVDKTLGDGTASSTFVPQRWQAGMSVENGSIMLETGCNSGSGKITVGEGQVTVGDVATTYMACPGLKMEIERDVFKVWTGETKYVIEGDQLRVTQGQITLVYTPKVMPPD